MAQTVQATAATTSFLLNSLRNAYLKGILLTAGADAATMKVYDGAIDGINVVTPSAAGTGYSVGDVLTLVAGGNGGSASRAIVRVTQIDYLSPSTSISSSVSSSPSTSISSSRSTSISSSLSSSASSSVSSSVSRSSSISSSPSTSLSVSTSVSSSPSPSASTSTSVSSSVSTSISTSVSSSPSTSISSSPSPSASRSTSISSSPSSSISSSPSTSRSTSISSSPSTSPSPSGAGSDVGGVTEVEVIFAGGGYEAGTVYATTSDDGGTGCTIRVISVADAGTLKAQVAAAAGTTAPYAPEGGIGLTTKGISVRLTGTSPAAFVTYE